MVAAAQEVIIAYIGGLVDTNTLTAGTGYTSAASPTNDAFGNTDYTEYHIVTASEAATASVASSSSWGIMAVSFKAASGSGGAAAQYVFYRRPRY